MDTTQFTANINQSLQKVIVFTPNIQTNYQTFSANAKKHWNTILSSFTNPLVNLAANLFQTAQLIATGYLFYTVQSLRTTLATLLLQRVSAVRPSQIPVNILLQRFLATTKRNNTEQIPTSSLFEINQPQSQVKFQPYVAQEFHILDAAILITLLLLGAYIIIRFAKQKLALNSTSLFADIRNSKHHTFIKIGKLPYQAQFYTFQANNFIEKVVINNGWFPILQVQWPSLSINNRILKIPITLALMTNVNPFTAYKIRKILKTDFDILIFTQDSNHSDFQLLQLVGSNWTTINAVENQTDSKTEDTHVSSSYV
jgi:hypothetical protein